MTRALKLLRKSLQKFPFTGLVIVLALASAAIILSVNLSSTTQSLNSKSVELVSTKQKLQQKTDELSDANAELSKAKADTESANHKLNEKSAALDSSQSQLSSTQWQLSSTQNDLSSARQCISLFNSTEPKITQYSTLMNEAIADVAQGSIDGINGDYSTASSLVQRAENESDSADSIYNQIKGTLSQVEMGTC